MRFYTVDPDYIRKLHAADPEVFYSRHKPYISVRINQSRFTYYIPLTSAKPKHAKWNDTSNGNFLVYELLPLTGKRYPNWVYTENSDYLKHILSVLEVKKMIPVPDNLCQPINFAALKDAHYRDLLLKEYSHLRPLETEITAAANAIYSRQISTGIVETFCCNFRKLESLCPSD